jgi:fluoride ion exporter CrcB/FEX
MITGLISAIVATLPSIKGSGNTPWGTLIIMISAIFLTGVVTLVVSIRTLQDKSLITSLRKD